MRSHHCMNQNVGNNNSVIVPLSSYILSFLFCSCQGLTRIFISFISVSDISGRKPNKSSYLGYIGEESCVGFGGSSSGFPVRNFV